VRNKATNEIDENDARDRFQKGMRLTLSLRFSIDRYVTITTFSF